LPAGPPIRLNRRSSYGPTRNQMEKPEITAPGDGIYAASSNTSNHTEGTQMSGTSMAAPCVSGAIALAMSKIHKASPGRQLNARQIRQLLIKSAMDSSRNHHPGRGFGILDVEKFLDSV
ncbi:MAG: S8 family serine peptidase, partial [Chloroflexota bacterium]